MRLSRPLPLLALTALVALVVAASTDAATKPPTQLCRKTNGGLKMGQEPAPSLFGINTGTFDHNHSRTIRDVPTAKKMGARWIHLTGDNITYPGGKMSFQAMDCRVNSAREQGLGVLMSLGGIRGACSLRPVPSYVTTCPPTTPQHLQAYGRYLRTLLTHFKGRVKYYESWMEPNHTSSWPSGVNASQYTNLLLTEYQAFRAADPSAKLIFGAPHAMGIGDNSRTGVATLIFTRNVLDRLHGRRPFDLVGLRAYRYPPSLLPNMAEQIHFPTAPVWRPLTWANQLIAYEQEFRDHGYGTPDLWLPEFGWPGNARPNGDYFPSEANQSRAVQQAYRALKGDPRLKFVKAAFWFNLRDYDPSAFTSDPNFFAHYGLLRNDFTRKPAAVWFEHFAHGGK